MGGMMGTKKDPNEHRIPVAFVVGPGPVGKLDPNASRLPKSFAEQKKPDGTDAVSGMEWYEVIRTFEACMSTPATEDIRNGIRKRLIIGAVSIVGVVLGFMCGFMMSFLGCLDGFGAVCILGLMFGALFIPSLVGLICAFVSANNMLPQYADLVVQEMRKVIPDLMAKMPVLNIDLADVVLSPNPRFSIRFLLNAAATSAGPSAPATVPLLAATVGASSGPGETNPDFTGPLPDKVPAHWKNQALARHFMERCSVPTDETTTLGDVLTSTFIPRRTRDRKGDMPTKLKMLTCHRVENSALWAAYQERRNDLLMKWPQGCKDWMASGESPCITIEKMAPLSDALESQVNEFYLWHGTSPQGAVGISEGGFRIDLSGSSTGSMFGPGAYFAECSSKADEYAVEGDGIYLGIHAVLLCRVVCGRMVRQTKPDWPSAKKQIDLGSADSVLGDREASVGTYREFVVYKAESIYPEYVILYQREFE